MAIAVAIVAVGQLIYNDIEASRCAFELQVIYGIENVQLFCLSVLIGYCTYTVCHEICEFALKGNLPSETVKKFQKIIVISIWTISAVYAVILTVLTIMWGQDTEQDHNKAENLGFASRIIQIGFFVVVATLFLMGYFELL